MGDGERIKTVRALGKRDMVRLWEASAGQVVTAEDFVPAHVPAGVEVVHWGKNSLPAFSAFQKRFTRADGRPGVVYGYNWNGIPTWTTLGPGYFVGHLDAGAPEGMFGLDYFQTPPAGVALPSGWPAIVPNERGLQRFIYAHMVDYMRKVSDGVTIGRAWRGGKVTDNYFVLARAGA
jgi:hypothetical protein